MPRKTKIVTEFKSTYDLETLLKLILMLLDESSGSQELNE